MNLVTAGTVVATARSRTYGTGMSRSGVTATTVMAAENLYRAKLTQTTVIRAFLTQAKHALEDIDLMDSDLDQIYTKIDQVVADVEHYDDLTKVGTRRWAK